MKINAVISKPSVKLNSADKTAIISAVVIAVSIIIGAVLYSIAKSDVTDTLCEYFLKFMTDFSNKNKPEIISGLIFTNIPYLFMMLIFGTSLIGTPAVFTLTAIKSIGMGLLTTFIYDTYSLEGIEYCLLVFFPGKFILVFAMILLTQNCCINSLSIIYAVKGIEGRVVQLQFDKFILRSVFIIILFVLASIVDFLMLNFFSSLFMFT